MKAPRELEMASMPEQGSRNQEKTPRELKSAPREHNENRCDEKKEVKENKYDHQAEVVVEEDYLQEGDTDPKQQIEENKPNTEVFKKVTFNLCTCCYRGEHEFQECPKFASLSHENKFWEIEKKMERSREGISGVINLFNSVSDIDERIIELSNYMKQLEYCYFQCGMFEMDIMIQWHRSNVKYEKVLQLLKQRRAEISKEAEDENNESYYKYRFILTIEHSEETDSVSGLSNVPANISPASPHYGGFFDGDKTYMGASAYHDAIVDEKDALGKQLNNINTEVKYATENVNNNADETNALDETNEANIGDASSTNTNNENADDDNDADSNNGYYKMTCDETGAIDKEGSAELAEDVTTDTGDETFSYVNKDNNTANEEEYLDGDLELKKASREKRAMLWLCVPGYYCYKYRKRKS